MVISRHAIYGLWHSNGLLANQYHIYNDCLFVLAQTESNEYKGVFEAHGTNCSHPRG
jgi:hypothetical protein